MRFTFRRKSSYIYMKVKRVENVEFEDRFALQGSCFFFEKGIEACFVSQDRTCGLKNKVR